MLDANPCKLVKTGCVQVKADRIEISGFEPDNGTCRDAAALALVWAIGRLQSELQAIMERPGGGNVSLTD